MNTDNNFSYKYSAKEAAEIKRIREKYAPAETNKLELLRRLDKSVGTEARIWSLTVGILGAVIMGSGMSLCLVGPSEYLAAGVCIGLVGIVLVIIAYPIYSAILKRKRKKIAPTILALTEELIK